MTIDRETPNAPASGTPKMSVIQGGKGKTAKGKTKQRSAPDIETGLTEKQEAFIEGILDGKGQAEAYRDAYETKNMTPAQISVEAYRMMRDPKITHRLTQLQAKIEAQRRMLSLSRWDRTLNFFERFMEDETVHPSIRTRNAELMGKHLGLFVERVETKDVTDKTADDIEAQIKARLGLS
jgi:hypothetical protein